MKIAVNIAKLPEMLRKPQPFNKDNASGAELTDMVQARADTRDFF